MSLQSQLKNEILILLKCAHPSIIKLHAVFEDKAYIYLIMEFANQGSLFQKLRREKLFPEPLLAKYMTDVIEGVVYLHSQNPIILHRDLKPENVLINDD